jgi:K+-transporting ATPase KdpF subunit
MDGIHSGRGVLIVADFWLAGIVSGLLLIYLVYALLKPEEF